MYLVFAQNPIVVPISEIIHHGEIVQNKNVIIMGGEIPPICELEQIKYIFPATPETEFDQDAFGLEKLEARGRRPEAIGQRTEAKGERPETGGQRPK